MTGATLGICILNDARLSLRSGRSADELVVLRMTTDPEPDDCVCGGYAEGSV